MHRSYVFDIDGTLTIVGDRLNCLEGPTKDWDSFYERCDEDIPNHPVFNIFDTLIYAGFSVWCLTGRRESTREKTLNWFLHYGITFPSERLIMRVHGDRRPDVIIKPEALQKAGLSPIAIFEDRNSVVKVWRDLGLTCFHVADGNF